MFRIQLYHILSKHVMVHHFAFKNSVFRKKSISLFIENFPTVFLKMSHNHHHHEDSFIEETSSLGGTTRLGTNYSATLVHRHRKPGDPESESDR